MTDIISELLKRISETKKSIADTVATGTNVTSYEVYQRLVGRNEGLQIALDLLDDVMTGDEQTES
jgi:hypothetical protein